MTELRFKTNEELEDALIEAFVELGIVPQIGMALMERLGLDKQAAGARCLDRTLAMYAAMSPDEQKEVNDFAIARGYEGFVAFARAMAQ